MCIFECPIVFMYVYYYYLKWLIYSQQLRYKKKANIR